MGYYTSDTFQRMLEDRKRKTTDPNFYMNAPQFQELAPQELTSTPQTFDTYQQLQDDVLKGSREATAIEMVKAQNRMAFEQMKSAQQQKKLAQQNFVDSKNYPSVAGGPAGAASSGYPAVNWGKDGIPEVSDIKTLNPHAPIKTVNWRGHRFGINSQVAPIFLAFLDNLARMGYVPKSIGGYANRNIAGTGTKSLHSYGFAIDIDPSRNPVTWNGQNITALPRGVGAMAARYGLKWGGDWNGSKRDTMHFSIPWNHTY